MGLVFEVAAPLAPVAPYRADVACFIGYVARRAGRPLPEALRAQLDAAGWVQGLWARPADEVDSLLNLPLALDSWHLFDRLYAWDERPLDTAGTRRCASYLGAAVRSFFARGGRRAIIVRVGDPWPCLDDGPSRAAQLRTRLRRLLPDFANRTAPAQPFEPHNPAAWLGIHHLYGLRETSLLLLPDLPDACATDTPRPAVAVVPPLPPETFVECSRDEAVPADLALQHLPAPRLDSAGYAAWQLAVGAARDFLQRWQREVTLVAALPLPHVEASRSVGGGRRLPAEADMLGYLQRIGVLLPAGSDAPDPSRSNAVASAFVQLGWPWLRCQDTTDLPQGLVPPDGVLGGLIARSALTRGAFASAAGDRSMSALRDVADAEPVPAWGGGEDSPAAQLARQVCLIAPQPGGWALQSDVTTSPQEAWRFGGASRLMGLLLRAARAVGDGLAFEPNGPALWARLRSGIEELLTEFWRAGGLAGASASQAFEVRCDRSTMTQNDLDNGRLVVRISVQPAVAIERITVVLNLGNSAGAATVREAA